MEDRQIIDLYFGRDESAITETKTKYGAYILTIAMNILYSTSDAEECENDTYLSAWNSMPPQEPLNLKTFLGRIARNLSIDKYRKNTAVKRGGGAEELLLELAECCGAAASQQTVESETDANELTRLLNAFLRELPQEKRILFIKRYWYGESLDDISMETGLTTTKIATTLFRVRGKLKDYLIKEGVAL